MLPVALEYQIISRGQKKKKTHWAFLGYKFYTDKNATNVLHNRLLCEGEI